ncbi:MAG TPA: class I SAM-dependent methyltransferase [Kofleriaceae bacterium]|jgi:SAM-dependent methyltransferase
MIECCNQPLREVLAAITGEIAAGAKTIELVALDPDGAPGRYAGEVLDGLVHRPWRVWVDVGERLGLRMLTPTKSAPRLVTIRYAVLDPKARLDYAARGTEETERYGAESEFAKVDKSEDPGFLLDFADALDRTGLAERASPSQRILDLGVNTGDELALIRTLMPTLPATLVGIDHSASAIAVAKDRFANDPRIELHCADVNQPMSVGQFDLVVTISTLQSAGLDDRDLIRRIVQNHLAPGGSVIIGVPNCRYVDGEVEYGARMRNFRQPELGLVVKDIAFYRKYFQQHHMQVFVTGKHYLFVTAVANVRSE